MKIEMIFWLREMSEYEYLVWSRYSCHFTAHFSTSKAKWKEKMLKICLRERERERARAIFSLNSAQLFFFLESVVDRYTSLVKMRACLGSYCVRFAPSFTALFIIEHATKLNYRLLLLLLLSRQERERETPKLRREEGEKNLRGLELAGDRD